MNLQDAIRAAQRLQRIESKLRLQLDSGMALHEVDRHARIRTELALASDRLMTLGIRLTPEGDLFPVDIDGSTPTH